MKREITGAAYRNGYYMGSLGQEPWDNTSQDYKEGFKEGEEFRRLKAKIQADKIINEMVEGE
jgi:hypothetical protein